MMGLAVKTDGAAFASARITDALIGAKAAEAGIRYQEGWMLQAATSVKTLIDVAKKPGATVPLGDIWQRSPKFVLGYFLTFFVLLRLALAWPHADSQKNLKGAVNESDVFRRLFFVMTFFTIGLGSNFKKLWEEGIGRLALVYVVSLFGFVIWIGLAISWLFFHGVYPPILQTHG